MFFKCHPRVSIAHFNLLQGAMIDGDGLADIVFNLGNTADDQGNNRGRMIKTCFARTDATQTQKLVCQSKAVVGQDQVNSSYHRDRIVE